MEAEAPAVVEGTYLSLCRYNNLELAIAFGWFAKLDSHHSTVAEAIPDHAPRFYVLRSPGVIEFQVLSATAVNYREARSEQAETQAQKRAPAGIRSAPGASAPDPGRQIESQIERASPGAFEKRKGSAAYHTHTLLEPAHRALVSQAISNADNPGTNNGTEQQSRRGMCYALLSIAERSRRNLIPRLEGQPHRIRIAERVVAFMHFLLSYGAS